MDAAFALALTYMDLHIATNAPEIQSSLCLHRRSWPSSLGRPSLPAHVWEFYYSSAAIQGELSPSAAGRPSEDYENALGDRSPPLRHL
jgi:hypothetical protein